MFVAREFIRLKPVLHRQQNFSQLRKLIFLEKHVLPTEFTARYKSLQKEIKV